MSGQALRVVLLHNIINPHVNPTLARLAQTSGIDLRVIFFSESEADRRWAVRRDLGFAYTVPPGWRFSLAGSDYATYHINPSVPRDLWRDPPDAVVSAGWDSFAAESAYFVCRMRRVPYVIWSGSTVNEPSLQRTLTLPLVKTIVRGSAAGVAYGTRAKEYLVRLGARPERVFIAMNTADVEAIRARSALSQEERAAQKAALGLAGKRVIMFNGRLVARKGVDVLLHAFAALKPDLPEAGLLLVGYGPEEARLKELAAALQASGVCFAGHVRLEDLPGYYACADVFVLPSWGEPWGLVINEAMAAGLPVVATDQVGASVDLIRDGVNGYVVPAHDVGALARALRQVLDDPVRAAEMGRQSARIIAPVTFDAVAEGILAAIRCATGQG
jgi:glycosyltransferase involved in cell wall biosynthesis